MISTEISKKDKVIEAAIKLVVDNGLNKVSTAAIAKTAGVAIGTMFHHFTSKDDIIISAYKMVKRSFITQANNSQKGINVKDDLQLMWNNLIEWSIDHPDQFRYMRQFANSPYYNREIMSQDDTWTSLLEWWKASISSQKIKDIPVEFLIKMFSNLLFTTIDYLIYHPENKDEYLVISFIMCWDMIGKHDCN